MKLLMFNTREFWYRPFKKTLDSTQESGREELVKDALVIFIHVEQADEEKKDKVTRKAGENILWLAKKTGRTRIVLHSFAHLSDTKSSPEIAQEIFLSLQQVLQARNLETSMTPFGYLNEFRIEVPGDSLAKVWKSL